jgi:hypothetical protein
MCSFTNTFSTNLSIESKSHNLSGIDIHTYFMKPRANCMCYVPVPCQDIAKLAKKHYFEQHANSDVFTFLGSIFMVYHHHNRFKNGVLI